MVLTEEEAQLARTSRDGRIIKNWNGRQNSKNLCEQTCCDREIQRYLKHQATDAYKLNCYIIHQAARFLHVTTVVFKLPNPYNNLIDDF